MADQGNDLGQTSEATSGPDTAPAAGQAPPEGAPDLPAETASLLGLIDKLSALLERSDLVELEIQSGETAILLRKPAALQPNAVEVPAAGSSEAAPAAAPAPEPAPLVPAARAVRAPLTGIYYSASSPSAPPYVTVGQMVSVGQVIGLIEAMKLFNEIKSDVSGRVVRLVAETGKLVKAKQPLIEVEP
jgi:acetyl-CoA carboxylase biotin carboxyl carrier protein